MKSRNINKDILLIFAISIIFRLIYSIFIYYQYDTTQFVDDWDYIIYAKEIIKQGICVNNISFMHENSIHSGPGFPLIISLFFLVFGHYLFPIIIMNAIISSLVPVFIYLLGKEIFSKEVGLASSIWSIFYVLHIRYIPRIIKEVWVIFFFLMIIYLIVIELKKTKFTWRLFILSLLYSYLIHMDERFFTYFPFFILLFAFWNTGNIKLGFIKAFIFTTIVVVSMLPWMIRNYVVYERPIILTTRTAKFTDPLFNFKKEVDKATLKKEEYIKHITLKRDSILNNQNPKIKTSRERGIYKGIQLGYIPHEFNHIERYWAEFKEFWRPIRIKGGYVGYGFRFEGPSWSLKHNLSVGLTYGILLPFFIIGCYFVLKNRHKFGIILIAIILIHMVIHVFLAFVRNRYRIPVDAFIILISFYAIITIYQQWHSKKIDGYKNYH